MAVIKMKAAGTMPNNRETSRSGEPPRLQEVLDVAAKLFMDKGYRSTSLADIGAQLGMNKASLYYYVKSKEELARQLVLRAAKRLRDVSRSPQLDALSAIEALEILVREHCAVILDHPKEMSLLIQQRRFVEQGVFEEIVERERLYAANLRAVIARGMEEGVFRRLDASVATQLVLDTVNGLLRWYRQGGRVPRERVIDEVCRYVVGGLRPLASARRRTRAGEG